MVQQQKKQHQTFAVFLCRHVRIHGSRDVFSRRIRNELSIGRHRGAVLLVQPALVQPTRKADFVAFCGLGIDASHDEELNCTVTQSGCNLMKFIFVLLMYRHVTIVLPEKYDKSTRTSSGSQQRDLASLASTLCIDRMIARRAFRRTGSRHAGLGFHITCPGLEDDKKRKKSRKRKEMGTNCRGSFSVGVFSFQSMVLACGRCLLSPWKQALVGLPNFVRGSL